MEMLYAGDYRAPLPWSRGQTLREDHAADLVSGIEPYAGKGFVLRNVAGVGRFPILLVILKNMTGVTLTARQACRFAPVNAGELGLVVRATNTDVNQSIACFVDPYYGVTGISIVYKDLFYGLVQGPCDIDLSNDSAVVVGDYLYSSGTAGKLTKAALGTEQFLVGRVTEAADANATNVAALVSCHL